MEKGKVLIFGNPQKTQDMVLPILKNESLGITYVDNIEMVNEISRDEKPKAIFIDIDTLSEEGFDLCRRLKDNFETRKSAIIFYASDADENSIIKSLEMGADDFLTNRFASGEIAARVRSIIRRIETNASKKIKVKDIEIDLDEHKVKKSGKPIDLTYIQFKLLYLLASRRDNVFSRKEILERVWGRKVYVTNRTVDVHIKRLREKLGEYKYPSQYIETIHGTGYRFL
jgi:DNA-binding response OmpR family regulator